MCDDSDPCAENYLLSHSGAYPCAITSICAIEARLLAASEEGDSDVELLEDGSDVELLEEAGGGDGVEEVDDEL